MKDHFYPLPLPTLFGIILKNLENGHFSGIPIEVFYKPGNGHLQSVHLGQTLETPVGPAAGPHTQLAQNIVGAWLCGARYIELKTVQTLDELVVPKPCIDMQDEGYNREWSQELKIEQSFNQYLDAWIIIHLLAHHLGWNGSAKSTIFNMSVGYNMEGILKPNIQWFLDKMTHCRPELEDKINELSAVFLWVKEVAIPYTISDNITLSTMHGCPPDEIEKIGMYLIRERGFHTLIKLNPTLLGPERTRSILNVKLGFKTPVPDQAFAHDLKFSDALAILENLDAAAKDKGVHFGIKLTNTLESNNFRNAFGEEKQMYMSGRALHPLAVNLAKKIRSHFPEIKISFSAGADCFNISDLIQCNLTPVTVSTDLLKPGGYGRLNQYLENLKETLKDKNLHSLEELAALNPAEHLESYSNAVLEDIRYKRPLRAPQIKTARVLTPFDCIQAPCQTTCPGHQDIPRYLNLAANQKWQKAFEVILHKNPFPSVTGTVCDHDCQTRCTRVHYDDAIAIREVKRYISSFEHDESFIDALPDNGQEAVVVGAGPAGLSCAWYLRLAGFRVTVYEEKPFAGGMVQQAIPLFRLPQGAIESDIKRISRFGVDIRYNTKVDRTMFESLVKSGTYIFLAIGAGKTRKLNIPGEDSIGVLDPLLFLADMKKEKKPRLEARYIAVAGGGNTAIDVARTARKAAGENSIVKIVYRRTIEDMPASQEEILAAMHEGIRIHELVAPVEVITRDNKVTGLRCIRMEISGKGEDGRQQVKPVPGSEFELQADVFIPAVGQYTLWDVADDASVKSAEGNAETSYERVFTGGDARSGPGNIIKAIADGRNVAEMIMKKAGIAALPGISGAHLSKISNLLVKRTQRIRSLINEPSPDGHHKIIQTPYQASEEAERCLLCDEICDICVTVCPNFANQGYNSKPVSYNLQCAGFKNGKISISNHKTFSITQSRQVFNIANFCNECGNCRTFCPTSGSPYIDKPKVHLTEQSLHASGEGFLRDLNGPSDQISYLDKNGLLHKLTQEPVSGNLIYETEAVEAVLNKETLRIIEIRFRKNGDSSITFETAAMMKVMMEATASLVGAGGR
jgi:putative selenate reductase